MTALEEIYNSRKKEINNFLEMMKLLESKERCRDDEGVSSFNKFFEFKRNGIELSYQELINIFKSNLFLMLYSIIEYTVSNLIDCIYDEIRMEGLSYEKVNDSIRKLWKKSVLKSVNDPNANFYTFIKQNDLIIEYILEQKVLSLKPKDTLPAGNLDGDKICKTFRDHGIKLVFNKSNYRPQLLENIKNKRNDLAHGTVSFVDAVKDNSISDLEQEVIIVTNFLEDLIKHVKLYLANGDYRKI